MSPVKSMEITVDQNDSNITASNGTVDIMSDIYVYKIPRHTALLVRPEDILSAYLDTATGTTELTGIDAFELILRDPNSLSEEVLVSGQYTLIKEFQDRTKTKKFGQSKLMKSDFQLAFRVKASTVLVVAYCYFQITALRYAEKL